MTDDHIDTTPYEEWVNIAFSHLYGSLDTAMDELDRDRDFFSDEETPLILASPLDKETRDACKVEAMRRFLAALNAEQESGDDCHMVIDPILPDNTCDYSFNFCLTHGKVH